MRPRVLVTRRLFEEPLAHLRRHAEVDCHEGNEPLAPRELATRLRTCRGLVCQLTDPVDAGLLAAAPDLAVIAQVAVGHDNIDVAAATERRIVVTNTPGVLTETTADLAFALLLAAARRVAEADRYVRGGRWRRWEVDLLLGHDLHDRTLGLVGFGRIGRAMARRARGFGMRILYHDTARLPAAEEQVLGVEHAPLEVLLAAAHFVSLHLPLDATTRHLIGARELAAMRPEAILVNTARGPVVDEAALADALATGRIAGAGLDVFEREPAVEARLLTLDNVVLAPHIGSASVATRTRMCRMAVEDCVAVLEGRRPAHPVNPEVLA